MENRGCMTGAGSTLLILGGLMIGWSIYLSQTRAGDTVSAQLALSFWLGLFCGGAFVIIGLVGTLLSGIARLFGGVLGRYTNQGGGPGDIIPDIGFLDDLFNRR